MVNVLKFYTFLILFSNKMLGFKGWNFKNACQNSKQGSLSRLFWHETSVQNFRTFTVVLSLGVSMHNPQNSTLFKEKKKENGMGKSFQDYS